MLSDHRVWAREIPVWATENPVTLSVYPQTPTLRPLNEGDFRGREGGFLIYLTKQRHSPKLIPYIVKTYRVMLALFTTAEVGGGFGGHSRC